MTSSNLLPHSARVCWGLENHKALAFHNRLLDLTIRHLMPVARQKAVPAMSPFPEPDGERMKQKQKKNKIGAQESSGSSSSGSCASEPSTFPLESSASVYISQETRPPRVKESWQPQVPWLRGDGPAHDRPRDKPQPRSRQENAGRAEKRATHREPEKLPERRADEQIAQEWKVREVRDIEDRWMDTNRHRWQSQDQYDQYKVWQKPQSIELVKRSENAYRSWGWGNHVQVSDDGLLSIRLSRMGLDFHALKSFCTWLPTELRRLKQAKTRRLYVSSDNIVLAHDVDLSQNDLDDEAMRILLQTFKQARVVIGVAKFYQNNLGCRSAILLSQWIRSAPWALFELHLSHNHIKTAGALELIKAIGETKSYPSARPGSKNWPLPLWLRLEHNDIPEADGFEQKAELCLQTARPEKKGKLICWFTPRSEVGCRSDNCGHSTADHCPVIHIPHLRPETRKGSGRFITVTKVGRARPAPTSEMDVRIPEKAAKLKRCCPFDVVLQDGVVCPGCERNASTYP